MKRIRTIVLTTLSIIGGIWVLIQIYTWATESKTDIYATIDINDFSIPLKISDQFSNFDYKTFKDSLSRENSIYNFKFFQITVKEFGVLSIRNSGDKEIKDIQIVNVPAFYEFSDSEGMFHSGLNKGKINVGNLRPTESVKLFIWGYGINEDDIRITYPDGVITPDKYIKVSGFIAKLAWMQRVFGIAGILFFLSLVFLFGYLIYGFIKFDIFKKKPKMS